MDDEGTAFVFVSPAIRLFREMLLVTMVTFDGYLFRRLTMMKMIHHVLISASDENLFFVCDEDGCCRGDGFYCGKIDVRIRIHKIQGS